MLSPFHLAFPVHDLASARAFYEGTLGAAVGRTSDRWIDFDFFGHQITAHLAPEECSKAQTNAVDGKSVPVRHFGIILVWETWQALSDRLTEEGVDWLIEPGIRFAGEVGEQGTFFLTDPSGNALEFKTFRDFSQIFAA